MNTLLIITTVCFIGLFLIVLVIVLGGSVSSRDKAWQKNIENNRYMGGEK